MLLLPGRGSSAVPWRANTGVGRKGKMKLRFVKFSTSRENEIERKEEGEGLTLRALLPSASPRPELRFSPALPSYLHHSYSLPPPSPTSPHPPPPQLTLRHVSGERCPPATLAIVVPLLPFLHKITEAEEWKGKDRGGAPSLPAQLSYSTITWRHPARRTLALPVARLSSTVFVFSRL